MTESEFDSLKIGDVIYYYCDDITVNNIFIIVGKTFVISRIEYKIASMKGEATTFATLPNLWHRVL